MNWDDEAYLLSKVNYNENSIIVDVLTQNHGKCSGIIYGGNSRKIKKYLQIGNKLSVSSKSRKTGKVSYFQIEPIKAIAPEFFDDKKKISCVLSATSILRIILPEYQINKKVYYSFNELIDSFYSDEWIDSYIYWEQLLIKELGYDINLFNKKVTQIQINGATLQIPEFFLLEKNVSISNKQINEALQFNKKLLISNFLDGNTLRIPSYRLILEKYYN